jgi:hypothetical protein
MVWQLAGDAVNKKQATILRTVWLGTRNGQRAKTEFGHEVAEVEVEFSKTITETLHGLKAEQDVAPENETKPDATKSTQPSNANAGIHTAAPRPLRGNHFNQRVGTSIEVDPIIGEDGRTIEMNLSMTYDYAMPTELPAAAPATEKNLQLEVNGHEFHRMNMNQAITMESGTWKMLNLWKPEGTAEFDGKDILQALFIRADIVRNEAKE